jgi:Uma2 family endonuclease
MNAPLKLESLSPPVSRFRFTVADYHRLAEVGILNEDSRVELIEGELVSMAPIGSFHQSAVDLLNEILSRQTENFLLRVQGPISLGEHSEPEPDFSLLKRRSDFYRNAHPGASDIPLVIEVSDSTLAYDSEIKLRLYAENGIPESWIFDMQAKQLEIHREPSKEGYRQVLKPKRGTLASAALIPQLQVDWALVF